MRRNEPASRAIWAARTLVNVKVMGRTHSGAWDGGEEAQDVPDDEAA